MRGIVRRQGFVLPTVVVASIVLLMVLVAALQLASSTAAALREQYYNQLAKEAAEAGSVMATACLQDNNMLATWSDSQPLTPQSNCDGTVASDRRGDIMTNGNIRTRFVVSLPDSGPASQTVLATGYAELLRVSDQQVVKSYSYAQKIIIGSQQRVNTVTFGYRYAGTNDDTFFTAIDGQGKVRGVGANGHGQLGNGATSAYGEVHPVVFGSAMPGIGTGVAVQSYTNFLSIGYALFVRNADGEVWGSGDNQLGLIGNDTAPLGAVKNPVKFQLPAGVKARSVTTGYATFVLGSDNNIYAAGDCREGLVGNGAYADRDHCPPVRRPVRVALPTPNLSDPNTIPTEEIITDNRTAYVRMRGGAVYGWGANGLYQLARSDIVQHTSTPVQIGDFGQPGRPKAVQMAFNGGGLYIVTNDGGIYASGFGPRGEVGKRFYAKFYNYNPWLCLDRKYAGNSPVASAWTCHDGDPRGLMLEVTHKGQVKSNGKCLKNTDYNTHRRSLAFVDCDQNDAHQLWRVIIYGGHRNANALALRYANWCVGVGNSAHPKGEELQLMPCSDGDARQHMFFQSPQPHRLPVPGRAVQVSSDDMFAVFRLDNGEVWGIGYNEAHALGSLDPGAAEWYVDTPVKFNLPSGVKAVDLYSTAYGTRNNNVYIVGDNGKVYGTGHNTYGQLGNGTTFQQTARGQVVEMREFGTISTSPKAASVQSGNGTTVIFTKDGQVYTVGRNHQGQLGDGTRTNRTTPIRGQYTNQPVRHSVFY